MTDRSAEWAARRRAWEAERLGPALDRAPERRDRFSTIGDTTVERLYGPWSSPDDDPLRDIGFPGEPPFTRGIHPTGYRSRLWTMRMFAGFGAAEDTNARFRQLLEAGQTGLSIAYDMPTLYGYDSDDPEAEGEFGTCGVGVSSLADMEILLDGLPLDAVSTSMTINSPAAPIWAMYIVAAEKAGVPRERLEGTTQNDILKEFVAQKEFLFPPLPVDAAGDRHHRVRDARDAALEHRLDQRLSHPRGGLDRDPGAGLHDRRRDGLRRGGTGARHAHRRLRAAAVASSSTATATSSRRSPSSGRRGGSGTS